jgi:hypothetical protein
MDVGLAIAGALCVALGLGHNTLGLVWILPKLRRGQLPVTPFGPASLTESMLRVTWYIVTIFAVAMGALLITLAWVQDADVGTVVLRWFAVMWIAATVMAGWVALRRVRSPRGLLRLPVPLFWVVIAVLCWNAST